MSITAIVIWTIIAVTLTVIYVVRHNSNKAITLEICKDLHSEITNVPLNGDALVLDKFERLHRSVNGNPIYLENVCNNSFHELAIIADESILRVIAYLVKAHDERERDFLSYRALSDETYLKMIYEKSQELISIKERIKALKIKREEFNNIYLNRSVSNILVHPTELLLA